MIFAPHSPGFAVRIGSAGLYAWLLSCTLIGCSANSGPQTRIIGASTGDGKAAPVVHFALTPSSVSQGQSTTATWDTQGATACNAMGSWTGPLALSNTAGTVIGPIDAAGTYSYGLTCVGAGGTTAVAKILMVGAVPAPTVNLTLTPAVVSPGSPVILTWSTANADSCTASGGTGSDGWSGDEAIQNPEGTSTGPIANSGEYLYNLTCTGGGGSSEQSRVVTVSASAPPAPPSLIWTVAPSLIQPGQSTTFTWSTMNATACTASGGSGLDGWGGVQPISSAGTLVGPIANPGAYSYSLNCSGPGGSVGKSVTVVVSAVQASSPTVVIDVSPTQIAAGGSASLTWSSANTAACTASGSWSGNQPLTGSSVSTGSLKTPAVYSYTLLCNGVGGSVSGTAVLTVTPGPATLSNFVATPSVINSGQSSSLSWNANATGCTASGGASSDGWGGAVSTMSSGTPVGPINSAGSYTYTLTCTGPGGPSAPASLTLTVNPAIPTVASVSAFAASPSSIPVGQASLLTWSTNSATACTGTGGTGSDGWNGSVGTSSSGTSTGPINTAGRYTYTLNCSGAVGAGSPASVIVNVSNAAPTVANVNSFSATPSTVQTGQASSLAWNTTNATNCTGSGGTGSDGWNGTALATSSTGTSTGPIVAAGVYTYTLTCSGPGGTSAPTSVIVNVTAAPPAAPTIGSFSAMPSTVQTGQNAVLTWSSNGATSCNATGGSGADQWTGSVGVANNGDSIGPLNSAGHFIYTLTCMGPGGSSAPSSVSVNVNTTPPVPSIGSFAANPTSVQVGGSIALAWSSSVATACTASGGTGADGWSGSEPASSSGVMVGPLSSAGTVTYTLTCSGAGGTTAPSSVSVNVKAAPPAATTSNFRATPNATQTGQSSLLSWSSSNAMSCSASGGSGADNWSGTLPLSSSGFSTGTLATAGTYTYGLLCTGAGGSSALSTAVITVTNAPPPATVSSFTVTPSVLQVGGSTQLAWTSTAASACTASGGTGADGWSGTKPVSSSGSTVGPINSAGTYIYTLTCNGPGGSGSPSSVSVTVNAAPPAASILTFAAAPSSVVAGHSTSLSWTTSAATSCTASGGTGTGSDGWGGATAASSSGTTVGPLPTAGIVTYVLTCIGSGGTSAPSSTNVTVTTPVPSQPTVTLSANGASSANIQPGASVVLSWSSANASSCSASGGSGSGWIGPQAISSSGISIGPIAAPGIYAFTLTCSGAGGSGSSTVAVTVLSTNSSDCDVGTPTTSLVAPAASAAGVVNGGPLGLLCIGCAVNNPGNLVDSTLGNYATLSMPLGVLGTTALQVTDASTFPAGRKVGFVIAEGNTLLSAGVLQGVTIETLLNGVVQESATTNGLLAVQALGLISVDPTAGFVEFTATKPFNSVEVVAASLASVLSSFKVYSACVSLQ